MATGITISNIFQNESGNVPASQLDTNFGQLASAFNSLLTYANYYVDVGAVNAISITVPSPLVLAYVAGLPLQIKVSNTNTGATTVNVNGLGAVSLVYPGTAGALSAGQLIAGGIYSVMYDGTDFQFLGSISATVGVTSVNAGTGINVSASTGNVTVSNTGVTSIIAGAGIGVSGSTGAVTINNTAGGSSSGTFTGTLNGMSGAGTITGTVNYAVTGDIASLYVLSSITGTSAASSMNLSGLPSAVQPVNATNMLCWYVENSGNTGCGLATVSSSGVAFNLITVSGSSLITSLFTASGTKGLAGGWCIVYPIA